MKLRLLGGRSESTDALDKDLMDDFCENPSVFLNIVSSVAFHPDRNYPELDERRNDLELTEGGRRTVTVNFFTKRRDSNHIQVGMQLKVCGEVMLERVSIPIDQKIAMSAMNDLTRDISSTIKAFAKGVAVNA